MRFILIIEDDIQMRRMIEGTINSVGENIMTLTAEDGENALQIAKSMAIDVFIVDIMLPDWDGVDLVKEIRKNYPHTPVIIESSKGNSAYQNKVLREINNIDFFKKPFSNIEFLSTVDYAMSLAEKLDVKKLTLIQNNQLRIFMLQNILYIEKVKNQKKISVVFYDSKINGSALEEFVGYTLTALLEMSEAVLCQCHKSFLINPKMVEKLNYYEYTMTLKYTETEIPIGNKYKNKIALLLGG